MLLKRIIYLLSCILTERTNPSCPYRDWVISSKHKTMHKNKMHCLPVLENSVKLQGSNTEKNEAMLSLTRKLPNAIRKHLCRKWVQYKTNRPLNAFFPLNLHTFFWKLCRLRGFFFFHSVYTYRLEFLFTLQVLFTWIFILRKLWEQKEKTWYFKESLPYFLLWASDKTITLRLRCVRVGLPMDTKPWEDF